MSHDPADYVDETDDSFLGDLLEELLNNGAGLFAGGYFDRVAVYHGSPVFDCTNQLGLHLVRQYATGPFTQSRAEMTMRAVVPAIEVAWTLVGCITALDGQAKAPKASKITSEAKALVSAGGKLWRGIVRQAAAGVLLEGFPKERFTVGELTPISASGGSGAYEIRMQITLG